MRVPTTPPSHINQCTKTFTKWVEITPQITTFAGPGLGSAKLFNGLRDQSVGGQDSGSGDFALRSRSKPGSFYVFRDLGRKTFFRLMGSRKTHHKVVVNS